VKKIITIAVASVFLLSGCATIVGDDTQLVQVNSNPSGASFLIKDESGKIITEGKTPQGVSLRKSDGSYFGKKSYEIVFSKENYKPVTLPIKASANGWYIGGNILFGGIIGWFAIDPFNGGMYTLSPKEANTELALQE
jgi:uncharacterized protein YceK